MFVVMYVRKEAVLSSQIEGTQSSLQDVLSAEAKIQDPKRPPDSGDVLNYIAAMDYGLARLQTLPLSTRLIREIHAKLMQNTRGGNLTPGELRQTQNWIGPAGCALQDAIFVPAAISRNCSASGGFGEIFPWRFAAAATAENRAAACAIRDHSSLFGR